MNIKILFFAKIRELLNIENTVIELNEQSTLNDLINILHKNYPIIKNIFVIYSLNKEYIYDNNIILNNNDIIALIPPISGG